MPGESGRPAQNWARWQRTGSAPLGYDPAIMRHLMVLALALPLLPAQDLPQVVVTKDDTTLSRSCRVRIPAGTIIPDAKGDGVLKITASGITVVFEEGTSLLGAAPGTPADAMTGIGVRIDGQKDVTLRNFRVGGYKVGIHASRAPGLVLAEGELRDLYRHRLRSTP